MDIKIINYYNSKITSGPYITPEGATCISTDFVSWCVLLVNYYNDAQRASADIVSTFVSSGNVWTCNQGSFSVKATSAGINLMHIIKHNI